MADTKTLETPDEITDPAGDETAETPDAPRFSIHPLNPVKPSLYDDAVTALIDAQEHAEPGETIAITILVPGDKKGKNRHLRDFREAATKQNKTARIRLEEEQADGSIAIDFTLTERITRQRDAAPKSAGASAASA